MTVQLRSASDGRQRQARCLSTLATAGEVAGTLGLASLHFLFGCCFLLLCAVQESIMHGSQCHSTQSYLVLPVKQCKEPSISYIQDPSFVGLY